ncbi:MAG: DUF305 domain-containing protein [Pseudomonadota bacterium]
MTTFTRASLLIAALGATGLASAQEQDHSQHHPSAPATATPAPSAATQDMDRMKGQSMDGMQNQSMSQGSQQMHQMHMDMMQNMHRMQMSGDTDRDFAMMMKHHHEQGMKMAEIEARNGKSPELKAMAHKVIQTQKQEIKKLDAWLNKNKGKK